MANWRGVAFTCKSGGARMHCGKKTSQCMKCEALGNGLQSHGRPFNTSSI